MTNTTTLSNEQGEIAYVITYPSGIAEAVQHDGSESCTFDNQQDALEYLQGHGYGVQS
jgi:hypothetical protein